MPDDKLDLGDSEIGDLISRDDDVLSAEAVFKEPALDDKIDDKNNDLNDNKSEIDENSDKDKNNDLNLDLDKDKDKDKSDSDLNTDPVFSDDAKLGFLKNTFGGEYEKIDDYANDYKTKSERVKELEILNKGLEDKAKAAVNPLSENKELAKQYYWMKETGKDSATFHRIQSMKLDDANPLDVMVQKFLMDNPSNDSSKVKRMFEQKYKLTAQSYKSEYDLEDEEQVKEVNDLIDLNKLSLLDDSSKIIKELKELKEKGDVPDFEKEQADIAQTLKENKEKNGATWDKVIEEFPKGFTKYQDTKPGDKEPFLEREVSDEERAKITGIFKDYVKNNFIDKGIAPTKEIASHLGNFIYNTYEKLNRYSIMEDHAKQKVLENNKMWQERTGQTLEIKKDDPTDNDSTLTSIEKANKAVDDEITNHLLNQ